MQPELDPLSQLRDIHFPADPGWWPPAPGWWILFFVAITLLCFVVMTIYRINKHRQPRIEALNALKAIESTQNPVETPLAIQSMMALIRRFTIKEFGREMVSSLHGEKWITFLKGASGQKWKPDETIERALASGIYEYSSSTDLEVLRASLLQLCRSLDRSNLEQEGKA